MSDEKGFGRYEVQPRQYLLRSENLGGRVAFW